MVTTYYGYTWWDNETDGELMYPKEQRESERGVRQQVRVRNPEASAQRGLWSDVEFLREDRHAGVQRPAEAHAVRRLPQPRLDLPRRLQARSQGQAARRRRQDRRRRRSGQVLEGRAPQGHPPRERACSASIAISTGQPRQRQALRRNAQRRRDRLRRLPRHDSESRDARHERPRRARRRHARSSAAHAVRRSAASSGATIVSISARCSTRRRSGKSCRCSTRSRPGRRTTASSRVSRRRFSATARRGARRRRRKTTSRTRTAR